MKVDNVPRTAKSQNLKEEAKNQLQESSEAGQNNSDIAEGELQSPKFSDASRPESAKELPKIEAVQEQVQQQVHLQVVHEEEEIKESPKRVSFQLSEEEEIKESPSQPKDQKLHWYDIFRKSAPNFRDDSSDRKKIRES